MWLEQIFKHYPHMIRAVLQYCRKPLFPVFRNKLFEVIDELSGIHNFPGKDNDCVSPALYEVMTGHRRQNCYICPERFFSNEDEKGTACNSLTVPAAVSS